MNNKILMDKIEKKLKKNKVNLSEPCKPELIYQTCNTLNYRLELN